MFKRNPYQSPPGCLGLFTLLTLFLYEPRHHTPTVTAYREHRDNDQISPDQRTWIEAALGMGVPLESLLIVEWEFSG